MELHYLPPVREYVLSTSFEFDDLDLDGDGDRIYVAGDARGLLQQESDSWDCPGSEDFKVTDVSYSCMRILKTDSDGNVTETDVDDPELWSIIDRAVWDRLVDQDIDSWDWDTTYDDRDWDERWPDKDD